MSTTIANGNHPTTEISITPRANELATIESIVEQCGVAACASEGHFGRAFKLAAGIKALSRAITPAMMDDIMALQGSGLGFRTDKDKEGGYDPETVKLCFIEAMLLGSYPVGNEFNIIAARPYLTKEFYTRKIREWPGLTDFLPKPGVPTSMGTNGALVPYICTWRLDGEPQKLEKIQRKIEGTDQFLDERIPVRVNSGQGADAILGKATRKMFKAVFEKLLGLSTPDGDVDDVSFDGRPSPRSLDDLTDRLKATTPESIAAAADAAPPKETPKSAPARSSKARGRGVERPDVPALMAQVNESEDIEFVRGIYQTWVNDENSPLNQLDTEALSKTCRDRIKALEATPSEEGGGLFT